MCALGSTPSVSLDSDPAYTPTETEPMRIVTNHEEHFVQMSCSTCLIECRVSTFSPSFEMHVSVFATCHCTCDSTGRPEIEKAVAEFAEHRRMYPTHTDFRSIFFPAPETGEGRLRVATAVH